MKKAICFSDVAINSPLIRWAHPLFPSVKESSVACWYFFSFYLFSPCSSLFFPQALCSSFCPYFFLKVILLYSYVLRFGKQILPGVMEVIMCVGWSEGSSWNRLFWEWVCFFDKLFAQYFFQLCCSLENDPFEFHLWLLKDNKINVIEVFPVPKHLASKWWSLEVDYWLQLWNWLLE